MIKKKKKRIKFMLASFAALQAFCQEHSSLRVTRFINKYIGSLSLACYAFRK